MLTALVEGQGCMSGASIIAPSASMNGTSRGIGATCGERLVEVIAAVVTKDCLSRGIHSWTQGETYGSSYATDQGDSHALDLHGEGAAQEVTEVPYLARTAYNLFCIAQPYRVAGSNPSFVRPPLRLLCHLSTSVGPGLSGMGTFRTPSLQRHRLVADIPSC